MRPRNRSVTKSQHRDRGRIPDASIRKPATFARTSMPKSCRRARRCWPSASSRRCTSRSSRSAPASAATSRRPRRRSAIIRRQIIELARANGLRLAAGGTHPFARWRGAGDLSRRPLSHHRRGHEDGGARQPDLRPARAHRHRRPRDRHPHHERRALLPAAHPGALHQLALLAGHGDRPALLPLQGLRQIPAHQHPRPVFRVGANSSSTSTCWYAPTASTTPRRSGGTSARIRTSPRSNSASATCPCGWKKPSPSPRSARP